MPDISAVREALMRRMGGGGTPALEQVSSPTAQTPTGGPNTPMQRPQMPQGDPKMVGQTLKAGQTAQSPMFDDDTRSTAKALVQKLLGVL